MSRNIANRSRARSLLVAVTLALGVLTAFSQPGRAFASFSGADRQEQPVASEPAAVAAAPAAPAGPSAAAIAKQQRMAAKQRAMQAAMARQQAAMARQQQAEGSRRAARRAFVGGLLIGVLAARRR